MKALFERWSNSQRESVTWNLCSVVQSLSAGAGNKRSEKVLDPSKLVRLQKTLPAPFCESGQHDPHEFLVTIQRLVESEMTGNCDFANQRCRVPA